jgi:uncharacterized protein (TIGR03435 family)
VFSAYGFTLEEIIVRAWEGNRWHVDIPLALRNNARYDFLMVLPRPEPHGTCLGLIRSAIEHQFGVHVTRETLVRDVYRLTKIESRGHMLKRYPDPEPGFGFAMLSFSVFRGRPQDAPMFPLDPFTVHSVPLMYLVNWFEEILAGQVIDETRLPGIYGFERACRYARKVHSGAATRSRTGDYAGSARDTGAHRAAERNRT